MESNYKYSYWSGDTHASLLMLTLASGGTHSSLLLQAEIFHLFFLCTNQSVFRSYFDPRLPFSPGVFRSWDIAVQSLRDAQYDLCLDIIRRVHVYVNVFRRSRIGHHQEKTASGDQNNF